MCVRLTYFLRAMVSNMCPFAVAVIVVITIKYSHDGRQCPCLTLVLGFVNQYEGEFKYLG